MFFENANSQSCEKNDKVDDFTAFLVGKVGVFDLNYFCIFLQIFVKTANGHYCNAHYALAVEIKPSGQNYYVSLTMILFSAYQNIC